MTGADDRPGRILNWLHARWTEFVDATHPEERPDILVRGNAYRVLHDDPKPVGESVGKIAILFAIGALVLGTLTLIAQLFIHVKAGI